MYILTSVMMVSGEHGLITYLQVVDQLISDINILNDVIVSDHKPVSFRVDINVNHSAIVNDSDAGSVKYIPQWDKCDSSILVRYANYMDHLLSQIAVPYDIIMDTMPLIVK